MARDASRKLDRIAAAVRRRPELADVLLDTIARVGSLESTYKRAHWGDEGGIDPAYGTIPDVSKGCWIMGELAEIGYLTYKGRRSKELDLFFHEFTAPLPLLCVAGDGSRQGLVVVRGQSRYTVNTRGIVG